MNIRSLGLMALAAFGTLTMAATPASAGVLTYTNFGYRTSFGTGYYFVSGPVNQAATYAAPFIATTTGPLDHIDLAIAGGKVTVSIYPDNGGVPGNINNGPALEDFLASPVPSTNGKPVKFASKAHPTLTAGQTYWVIVAPLYYDTITHWSLNTTGVSGVDASFAGGNDGSWAPYTANGSVTPAFDVWVQ